VNPVIREAARALVLGPDDRVLLVRFVNPETGAEFWTTPGGGLDPGEGLRTGFAANCSKKPVLWTSSSDR
jgi:8-oxo-dGTP pyrophosphatase MutT (NUDIX family)